MLPKSQKPDAAKELAIRLPTGGWKELRPTQLARQKVTVGLPRFKLSFGVADIGPHLKDMGLAEAFNGTGQFLRMSTDPEVHIDKVLHKAVLEVNEEGTVASAATATVMKTRCIPPPEQVVIFDRPFTFAIEHVASEELLSLGIVGLLEFSCTTFAALEIRGGFGNLQPPETHPFLDTGSLGPKQKGINCACVCLPTPVTFSELFPI